MVHGRDFRGSKFPRQTCTSDACIEFFKHRTRQRAALMMTSLRSVTAYVPCVQSVKYAKVTVSRHSFEEESVPPTPHLGIRRSMVMYPLLSPGISLCFNPADLPPSICPCIKRGLRLCRSHVVLLWPSAIYRPRALIG